MSADECRECAQCGDQVSVGLSSRAWCDACEETADQLAFPEINGRAPNVDQSPFDAGRTPCPQGGEDRWSARWLMEQMGYSSWQYFEPVVERAKQAAANQGFNVRTLFMVKHEMADRHQGGGRKRTDYMVSRFAAYLIAQNGDPRKPECAAAQVYFAVRTRQAELAEPTLDLSDPLAAIEAANTRSQQAIEIAKAERARAEKAESEARLLTAAIERDAPLVAKAEAHTGSDSDIHRQEFAREVQAWGAKQNLDIKQADVLRFLGHIGLFIRGERSDTGHATADAHRRGLAFTHKDTARNGYAYAVGKLTPAGQDYAWKRIIRYVAEHGSLQLPRELRGGDPA